MPDQASPTTTIHDPLNGLGSPEMRGVLNRWRRSSKPVAFPTLAVRQINVPCVQGDCVQVRLVAKVSGRRVEIWQTNEDGLSALTIALERFDLRCARVSAVALLRGDAGIDTVLPPITELPAALAE